MTVFDAWRLASDLGDKVTPLVQFVQWIGPGCAFAAVLLAGWGALDRIHDAIRNRPARSRIPAAPDNQPGHDPQLLWECRRIHTTSRKEAR